MKFVIFGRSIVRFGIAAPIAALLVLALAACGGTSATPTPTPGTSSTPTAVPSATTPTSSAATPTATSAPAATPTQNVSFAGKTIKITVGYAPGGGFDTYSRIIAAYLPKALQGNPQVVVTNEPGGDTLVAATDVMNKPADPNTINIVAMISSLPIRTVLGQTPGFDPSKLIYLASPDPGWTDITLCVHPSAAQSLDQFMKSSAPITVAGLSGISNYDLFAKMLEQLGAPIKLVLGYGGTSEMIAAFNRNEVQGTPSCRDADEQKNTAWVTQNQAVPLIYQTKEPDWVTAGQKGGKWPWVESLVDFAKAQNASADQMAVINTLNFAGGISHVFAAAPSTSPAEAAALETALEQIIKSQAFQNDMSQRGYSVGLTTGAEVKKDIDGINNLSSGAKQILGNLFKQSS